MSVCHALFRQLALPILATIALAGCAIATRSGPQISTTPTTGCPDALGPITAPIVAAAGSTLVAIAEDGSNQTWPIALSLEASAAFPAWSPDGQTLAYALRYPAPTPKLRGVISVICGLDRATGKGRLLAAGGEDDWLDEPVWSPDGRTLLLTLNRYQPSNEHPIDVRNVARYDLATETLHILIPNAHSPALSSTGDRLVYVAGEPKTNTQVLYIAQPDGQQPKQLITLKRPYVSAMWPRWSPDDTHILFGAGMVGGDEDERYAPCLVSSDGQKFQQLSKDVNNVVSVDWGPNGRQFIYATSGTGMFIGEIGHEEVRNIMQASEGMGVSWAPR